ANNRRTRFNSHLVSNLSRFQNNVHSPNLSAVEYNTVGNKCSKTGKLRSYPVGSRPQVRHFIAALFISYHSSGYNSGGYLCCSYFHAGNNRSRLVLDRSTQCGKRLTGYHSSQTQTKNTPQDALKQRPPCNGFHVHLPFFLVQASKTRWRYIRK